VPAPDGGVPLLALYPVCIDSVDRRCAEAAA
jgi:hypothetical protein